MASSAVVKAACVMVVCLMVLMAMHAAEGAITCKKVDKSIAPCMSYLHIGGHFKSLVCCIQFKSLVSAAKSTADRMSVCTCLKKAFKSTPNISYSRAGNLPGACGVNIPYEISPDTDCSKIK